MSWWDETDLLLAIYLIACVAGLLVGAHWT